MIDGYWWQGVRRPVAGYGGTLWVEGRDLTGPDPRAYFGATYLPVREVLSSGLLGVDLGRFRPGPNTARCARLRLMFHGAARHPMQLGGLLTLRPELDAPTEEILRYETVGTRRVLLSEVHPYGQLAVQLSFLPTIPPQGFMQWGAHRLSLLGMDRDGSLFVQIPPGTPAGTACVCLREPGSRPIWGPPLRILPLDDSEIHGGREAATEP